MYFKQENRKTESDNLKTYIEKWQLEEYWNSVIYINKRDFKKKGITKDKNGDCINIIDSTDLEDTKILNWKDLNLISYIENNRNWWIHDQMDISTK